MELRVYTSRYVRRGRAYVSSQFSCREYKTRDIHLPTPSAKSVDVTKREVFLRICLRHPSPKSVRGCEKYIQPHTLGRMTSDDGTKQFNQRSRTRHLNGSPSYEKPNEISRNEDQKKKFVKKKSQDVRVSIVISRRRGFNVWCLRCPFVLRVWIFFFLSFWEGAPHLLTPPSLCLSLLFHPPT